MDAHGFALTAQLRPDEFLVTGIDGSVSFHLPGKLPRIHSRFSRRNKGSQESVVPLITVAWPSSSRKHESC
jgi:hypothetical protein